MWRNIKSLKAYDLSQKSEASCDVNQTVDHTLIHDEYRHGKMLVAIRLHSFVDVYLTEAF